MSNGMRNRAKKAKDKVDKKFADRETELIRNTTFDWASIKPDLADDAEYERLMAIVKESTEKNETLGQLVTRLKGVVDGGVALAEKVKNFVV